MAQQAIDDAGATELPVYYHDGVTPVQLGDRVSTKIWFRPHQGKVIYVPGLSPKNGAMERDGLREVVISLDRGGFVATVVMPETGRLKKNERFLARGDIGDDELGPNEDPFENDSFASP